MTEQQNEIIKATEAELGISGRIRRFRVTEAVPRQNTIQITISTVQNGGGLTYTLEGGVVSWGKNASLVVSISMEDSVLYVHLKAGVPLPARGSEITVQPPKFLEGVLRFWRDSELANQSFAWAARTLVGRARYPFVLRPSFPELRTRQREAYSILSYEVGFLWGPPGTGKTRTAASIAADALLNKPTQRILLLAPTNSSVDQLLIAVDERLSITIEGQQLRTECARIGSNFTARLYENRRHLLPEASDELLLKKAQLESTDPSMLDVDTRAQWQKDMDAVLALLRSEVAFILDSKKVVAMTTALATMHYNTLRDHAPFDLIVFDEASQIGRAISLMLAPLGRRVIVAGDPKQLAPIFEADGYIVNKWLGQTLLDAYMDPKHPSTCFLNEQSRMATPICTLVSDLFYDQELRVSHDCADDHFWQAQRQPLALNADEKPRNLHLVTIGAEAVPHGRSQQRQESANAVAAIAAQMMDHVNPAQILVLTPFVAQRKLIRKALENRGLGKIRVSTVHAAQGAERPVVILDPVKGNSPFLTKPENRARLITVAISRAQRCFVLLASQGDLEHPFLRAIAEYIHSEGSCAKTASIF